MKRKLIYFSSVLALIGLFMASGCKNYKTRKTEKIKAKNASPATGNWRLLGFINPGSHDLIPLPEDQGRGVVFNMKDDGTTGQVFGHTKMNDILGNYTVTPHHKIEFTRFGGTKVGEPKWGTRIWRGMKSVHSFEIHHQHHLKQLHLVYDEANAKMVFEIIPEEDKKKSKSKDNGDSDNSGK